MDDAASRKTARIEAALWIVMGVLAFLAKDNPRLVYPHALYLFITLLVSSLATSLAIRRLPGMRWLHYATLAAGFGSVVGLQCWSGGAESRLWTLYLLPVFTAAILMGGRALASVTAGSCVSVFWLYAHSGGVWNAAAAFEFSLKIGVLLTAAAATWSLARAEREADARVERQRRVIERLEESARAAAESQEREKGLVAIASGSAGAAHDLSTPLMVIRAYARLHLERAPQDEALMRDLLRIESAASFCQDLVQGMLSSAGAPAQPRRLSSVLESALALAEPILRTKQLRVDRFYSQEPLVVIAPQIALERVVLNLVGNAAKAMPAGGTLTLRMERAGDSEVAVVVEDDGPGIPPELLSKLFQPFATTRAGKGGHGLGLYVSREQLRQLGGSLEAGNRDEGGARFIMRLPLGAAEREPSAAAA